MSDTNYLCALLIHLSESDLSYTDEFCLPSKLKNNSTSEKNQWLALASNNNELNMQPWQGQVCPNELAG
jgi:hypothetical protein